MEVNYRIEIDNNGKDYFEYFIQGKGWTIDQFSQAIDACIEELEYFPKKAQIIERRPKKYRKIEDIDEAADMARVTHKDSSGDDYEAKLDSLTREQVYAYLLPLWDDSTCCNTPELRAQACESQVTRFFSGDSNVRHVVKLAMMEQAWRAYK